MNFLNEDDVYENAVIPIYLNDKVEAYAKLIQSDEEMLSFMEKADKEDDGEIYIRQRWLIEWVLPDKIEEEIPTELKWTQRSLAGKRTHRTIIIKMADSWEQYSYRYGGLKDKNYYDRGNERSLPDSSTLF